ncbi:MAG: hypothetical protein R3D71_10760 [Rickettsiales bacterium]
MYTNIRYILITALRDWLFVGLMLGVLIASSISVVLGGTAFIEEQEMTLSYASASSRVVLMVGIIVFVCFHIRHSFDNKEIDVILSKPISRNNLIVSYLLGFSLVGLLLTLPVIAIIFLIGINDWTGFMVWSASFILEMIMIVSFSLFAAFTMRSAVTSVLACMGFYVISRMMAFFVMTADNPMFNDTKYILIKWVLKIIAIITPRLDFYSKSEWLVYGINDAMDWQLYLLQSLIFIPLLVTATIIDFRHRQF